MEDLDIHARTGRPKPRRRLLAFVAGAVVLGSLLLGNPSAHAAANSWEGQNPYATPCIQNERHLGTYVAWGPWGEVGAYVELHHSYNCGTAWLLVTAPFSQYTGTSYIWNPGKPAKSVPVASGFYRTTVMVDDRPGVETCLGTHLYRYGSYWSWTFHLCYR